MKPNQQLLNAESDNPSSASPGNYSILNNRSGSNNSLNSVGNPGSNSSSNFNISSSADNSTTDSDDNSVYDSEEYDEYDDYFYDENDYYYDEDDENEEDNPDDDGEEDLDENKDDNSTHVPSTTSAPEVINSRRSNDLDSNPRIKMCDINPNSVDCINAKIIRKLVREYFRVN